MDPTRLSRELRLARSDDLRRRRWVVGLSLAGIAIGGIVGAYQTGMIRHLPDPPAGPFDADRVDASDYAYKRMSTPDGLLMTTTFAVTASLAGAGGADRAERQPFLPIATAAKALYDAGTAPPPRAGGVAGQPRLLRLLPGGDRHQPDRDRPCPPRGPTSSRRPDGPPSVEPALTEHDLSRAADSDG